MRLDHFSNLIELSPTTALGPTVAEVCPLKRWLNELQAVYTLVEATTLSLNTELKLLSCPDRGMKYSEALAH
jgi:hypothetical protein